MPPSPKASDAAKSVLGNTMPSRLSEFLQRAVREYAVTVFTPLFFSTTLQNVSSKALRPLTGRSVMRRC
jgi:hypothetical protein